MVSNREMRKILSYSSPYILENLASVDFLSNNTQRVNGRVPFYDDMSEFAAMTSKRGKREFVSKRPTIHLKDSWILRFSASGGIGTVRLSNNKRDATGKWNISDLLWKGTRDYRIDVPDLTLNVPVMYHDIASAGIGRGSGWRGVTRAFKAMNRAEGKDTIRQTIRGHSTGAMSYYNRYAGKFFYNQTFRRGIRSELVTSFRQFILLCVENGVRRGIAELLDEGLISTKLKDVHVRIAK